MGFLINCPICNQNFNDDRAYTGTSGVAFPNDHPLFKFCDAGLHFDCLENWKHRKEFSKGYFDLKKETFDHMGTLLHQDENWILGCGPAPIQNDPYYAEIVIKDWPCRLYAHWNEWDSFIKTGYQVGLVGEALIEAIEIVNKVSRIAPDLSSLSKLRKMRLECITNEESTESQ